MTSDLQPQRDDDTILAQTIRRRWLSLCSVVGITGLAGCIDTIHDEQTDDTPADDDEEPVERAKPDSFAYEWEQSLRIHGEWREREFWLSGYITDDGDFFEESEEWERYGTEDTVYTLWGGECHRDEDEYELPPSYDEVFSPTIDSARLTQSYQDPVETTSFEGTEVDVYEERIAHLDIQIYIEVDTNYLVRIESEGYARDDDPDVEPGELISTSTWVWHTFGEQFTVSVPPEC